MNRIQIKTFIKEILPQSWVKRIISFLIFLGRNELFRIFLSKVLNLEPNSGLSNDLIIDKNLKSRKFFKKLRFPISMDPEVSIVLTAYNNWNYTYSCLKSILEHSRGINYEIVIGDNASTDKTKEIARYIENIKVVRNGENLGFLKNCNNAVNFAKGEFIVLLNNDTNPQPNWLHSLIDTIKSNGAFGAVGSRLIYFGGKLQEAGSILWKDGGAFGYGRLDDPNRPEYNFLREVDFTSFASIIIRRKQWNLIGGFDEIYSPAYYEDVDFSMSLKKLGFKVIYQPKSIVAHMEYGTMGSNSNDLMKNNHQRFFDKWKVELESDYYDKSAGEFKGRDRVSGKRRILFIDDMMPDPSFGAGFPRTYSVLLTMLELDYDVTYYPMLDKTKYEPITSFFQNIGVEMIYGDYSSFKDFLKSRKDSFSVIFVSRPHNMKILNEHLGIIERKKTRIVYDAEAIFALRDILKDEMIKNSSLEERKGRIFDEVSISKYADTITVVSEYEKKLFQEYYDIPVAILSHKCETRFTDKLFQNREGILFVGRIDSDSPNEDSLCYFIEQIFPLILKHQEIVLNIVGILNSSLIRKLKNDYVKFHGQVENLYDFYNHNRIFIIPTRYASGIPIKYLEAASYGLPSVTTELISSQLSCYDKKELLIGKNAEEFSEKCLELYNNSDLWSKIRFNAFEKIQKENNDSVFNSVLKRVIENN